MTVVLDPVPAWFTAYLSRGFHLIDYDQKKKGPEGVEATGWTNPDRHVTTPEQFKPDRNWGVFLGVEVQPGRFLVDVDFDWDKGKSLANRLLPDTFYVFGRPSSPNSHAFYTVPTPVPSVKYEDIDRKTTFVELRAADNEGAVGLQTMLPHSIHPAGEEVLLKSDGEIRQVEGLPRRVQLYAVACLFLKYLGEREFRHDLRLALSGFLLQEGLSETETVEVCEALAFVMHNDVRDVRFTVRSTIQMLKRGEPVSGAGIIAKALGEEIGRKVIRQARIFLGTQVFREDKKGNVVANSQQNIRVALDKMHLTLGFNEFSGQMFAENGTNRRLVDDSVIIPLWLDIEERFQFRPSKEYFVDVVRKEAWRAPYHPVRTYLAGLKWDGINRLDTWLIQYAGVKDTAYVRAVSAIVLIAAVRRVRQPGCKFDEMLILESARQGTGKSTTLATLCPQSEWFSDDLPLGVDSKQVIERTAGKWIIEASELHGHRQREADHMKSFLSRQRDGPVRLAYDRTPTEVPRQFILIGTTNTLTGYLKDFSGARRFWPMKIEQFDLAGLRAVRDQLWAEAAWREMQGESIRLPESLWWEAEVEQDERRAVHPWEELIDAANDDEPFLEFDAVPVNKIWSIVGVLANQRSNTHAQILNEIMQRKGFTGKARVYVKDEESGEMKQTRCWVRQSTEDETAE